MKKPCVENILPVTVETFLFIKEFSDILFLLLLCFDTYTVDANVNTLPKRLDKVSFKISNRLIHTWDIILTWMNQEITSSMFEKLFKIRTK